MSGAFALASKCSIVSLLVGFLNISPRRLRRRLAVCPSHFSLPSQEAGTALGRGALIPLRCNYKTCGFSAQRHSLRLPVNPQVSAPKDGRICSSNFSSPRVWLVQERCSECMRLCLSTPGYAAYAASKGYVLLLGEALSRELSPHGVSVTTLSPGLSATAFGDVAGQKSSALRKILTMQPRSVAEAGVLTMLDGKASVVPGVLNKAVVFFDRLMPRAMQRHVLERVMAA